MRTAFCIFMLITALAVTAGARTGALGTPADLDEVPFTLNGCVVAGDEPGSYMLTNVIIGSTAIAPPYAFFRLTDASRFDGLAGRRVIVAGKADLEDADEGRIRVSTEDGTVTTSIRSERRTVSVSDPLRFGTAGSMKIEAEMPTYKFTVDKVQPVAGRCRSGPAGAAIP